MDFLNDYQQFLSQFPYIEEENQNQKEPAKEIQAIFSACTQFKEQLQTSFQALCDKKCISIIEEENRCRYIRTGAESFLVHQPQVCVPSRSLFLIVISNILSQVPTLFFHSFHSRLQSTARYRHICRVC